MQKIHHNTIRSFRKKVYTFYESNGRGALPWRKTKNPYRIMVSEIMLQQTQVDRVIQKYKEFLKVFPTIQALADAPKESLLKVWQGLGYNRRALFLQKAAQLVVSEFKGKMPLTEDDMVLLPGIGPATASAICAYAYNQPVAYVETNIRAVIIYHFFKESGSVSDAELFPIIEQCIDHENPRQWYSALMDYGTYLKKKYKNPARKSKHHIVQSKFKGSDREIRGAILRILLAQGLMEEEALITKLGCDEERFHPIVEGLLKESFVSYNQNKYGISVE